MTSRLEEISRAASYQMEPRAFTHRPGNGWLDNKNFITGDIQASIAISLKRIADALTLPKVHVEPDAPLNYTDVMSSETRKDINRAFGNHKVDAIDPLADPNNLEWVVKP